MTIEVEVPHDLIESLETDPESFAKNAVCDRKKIFDQSLELLHERGWSRNEIEWAVRALCCGALFPDIQEIAEEQLEFSNGWPQENPQNEMYDISKDRSDELVTQFRQDAQLATALIFAARVYGSFRPVP